MGAVPIDGTTSNDSNHLFFALPVPEMNGVRFVVFFLIGFSDASYSLSLFTQEANSTSSSVPYYSWKKSKHNMFPVKSLIEGMNKNMGTFSPNH